MMIADQWVAGGFAPNRVRAVRVGTHLSEYTYCVRPKYAYYLEYFSFLKREKRVTTSVIGGSELEKGREQTWWVRTRLGAKPASFDQ